MAQPSLFEMDDDYVQGMQEEVGCKIGSRNSSGDTRKTSKEPLPWFRYKTDIF
jgi:hypothetical protein